MPTHYTRTSGNAFAHGAGAWSWFVRPMTPVRAALILIAAAALAAAILPFDGTLMGWFSSYGGLGKHLGGDVKRELEFVQQFGAITSVLIVVVVVWLNDPQRRTQVLGVVGAVLVNSVVMYVLKVLLGRARPRVIYSPDVMQGHDSVWSFTLPWGTYPLPRREGADEVTYLWAHSWDLWRGISSDLWSMPSSHAGAAACLAAALARLYPRLTPLLVGLALIAGCARVLLGAHFVSDVVVGWAVGYCVGAVVMDRFGSR